MITIIASAALAAVQPTPAPTMQSDHSKHANMKSEAKAEECCCKDMEAKKAKDAKAEATKSAS